MARYESYLGSREVMYSRSGSSSIIFKLNLRDSTPIERIIGTGPRRDGSVVELPGAFDIPLVEVKVRQLLEISHRRILRDQRFEVCDALSSREALEGLAEQANVGNYFN